MDWISVKDKKPNECDRVLCFNLDVALICYGVCIFNGNQFIFDATLINNLPVFEKISDKPVKVSHWMPIPKIM